MDKINKNKTGLLFAIMIGGVHLLWSILVLTGLAQSLVNFIFRLHMINPFITVADFNLGLSISLVFLTAIIGYIVGNIFATVWNYLHK